MTKPLKTVAKPPRVVPDVPPYDPAQADLVLDLIENHNMLMNRIWARSDTPSASTWRRWIDDVPGLHDRYARARESVADHAMEEIRRLATETMGTESNAARVKIDALKWVASKLRPRAYGDKLDVSGQVISASITVDAANLAPDQRAALRALLGSAIGSVGKPEV